MSAAGREAFPRELTRARECNRGNILHATASWRCEDPKCPVTLVRVGFSEQLGTTKPMPNPVWCCRCAGEMTYVGLELAR